MKKQMTRERKHTAMWPQGIFMAMVVVAFALVRPCFAATDVQSLYDLCKSEDDTAKYPFCVAYIAGVGDMMQALGVHPALDRNSEFAPFAICAKPSYAAMVEAFLNWAKANPQEWGTNRIFGVMLALDQNWPCDKK
jgi:hypothetical protein